MIPMAILGYLVILFGMIMYIWNCIYICCLLPDFMQLKSFGEACFTKNYLMFSLEFVF